VGTGLTSNVSRRIAPATRATNPELEGWFDLGIKRWPRGWRAIKIPTHGTLSAMFEALIQGAPPWFAEVETPVLILTGSEDAAHQRRTISATSSPTPSW
jgi:hypothetical protein